ncbi:hypothetical protein [Caniella muris]|uniref:hypothetical protein n=1 Tax=Caniella muris TaxID=2941502 RepID=UPI00203DBFF7|nr:hypothetical protein [Caniella muris]
MESVVVAVVSGVLTLAGVLVSNSRSRGLLEAKVDALDRKVEKHNRLIERTYVLERDVAVIQAELSSRTGGSR